MVEKGKCIYVFAGIFLAFLSGILFTANSALIKYLELDFEDVLLVRAAITLIIALTVIKGKGQNIWALKEENIATDIDMVRGLLIFQGVCNALFTLGSYVAIICMPLGEAMSIVFSTPLATIVLARIFLGERLRLYKIAVLQ